MTQPLPAKDGGGSVFYEICWKKYSIVEICFIFGKISLTFPLKLSLNKT
jgi:hypothetical protein